MPIALEDLARQAIGGDRDALDRLVRALQGDVYGLALRMLWNREDAEDATQAILVRTVTRLAQFDFRSRLKTWVYRIAVNYVLDVKKSPVEHIELLRQCKVRCQRRIVWRHAHELRSDLTHAGQASRSVLLPEHLRSEPTGRLNEGRSDEPVGRRCDPVLDDTQVGAAQESQDDVVAIHRLKGLPQ